MFNIINLKSLEQLRQATLKDIPLISHIESQCFPETEAASLSSFKQRYAVFPECFFVLESDGILVGHINGCIYNRPELPDLLYEDASLHCPNGAYQTVFGLAVTPEYQHRGYASKLIQHLIRISQDRGLEGMVLTCKTHLIGFYQQHGFEHKGVSASTHGGVSWHDMLLVF